MQMGVETNAVAFVADLRRGSVADDLADAFDGFEGVPIAPENAAVLGQAASFSAGQKGWMHDSCHQRTFGILHPIHNLASWFELACQSGVTDEPALAVHHPFAGFEKRVSREVLVEDMLFGRSPAGAGSPAHAQFAGEVGKAMVADQKSILLI